MTDRRHAWDDEYTLLCERCGYVIEGLATDEVCPECGKPIAESLPERRVGSAWQRRRGFVSALKTGVHTVLHPLSMISILKPQSRSVNQLRGVYCIMAAIFVALGVSVHVFFVWWDEFDANAYATRQFYQYGSQGPPPDLKEFLLFGIPGSSAVLGSTFLATWGLFVCLTMIEESGLVVFGRSRQTRLTRSIARTICAHGAVGWVAVGAGVLSALIALQTGDGAIAIGCMAVALAGFGFFEVFAYLGARRMCYANRARADT